MQRIVQIGKNIWPYLVILLFCLWAIKPLFVSGFFTIHDDEQIARLFEMSKVIGQGQIPPRWVPDLGFGYGYPLFNFYPPLVYYVGAIFHAVGFSLIVSTKLVIALGFFLSGIFMYAWTKNRFGILAGLFAAFLYIYAPYHSVDIYVRGALSEFFSFVFIPAVFWAVDRLAKNPSTRNVAIASVLLSLVVVTHTLVMLQFALFLLLYILFLFWENRSNFWKLFLYFFLFSIVGFGLSAYFAIPSVVEKHYTLVDSILITQLANYAIHFVCPSQFWNSLWGYGGSAAGCLDGLSFQVGKIQIFVAGAAVLLAVGRAFFVRSKKQLPFVIFSFFLFFVSLFMATDYSKILWDHIQPFWYIQFPWRFLLFSAVFSSFLGGYVMSTIAVVWNKKVACCIGIVLCALAFFQIRNDFQPQTYLPVGDNYYTANRDIQWRVSRLSYEYVPKEVATRLSVVGTTELAIDKKDIPATPFSILSGKMSIQATQNTAIAKRAIITATKMGILQVNTYAFPGWEITVDGKVVRYSTNNPLDLMRIPIPVGTHIVQVNFGNTPIRTISNTISIISLLVALVCLFWLRRKKARS